MLTVNTVKICALLLLLSPTAALAGGSDGGGSRKQGKLLDTQARENTIEVALNEELHPRLQTMHSILAQAIPDFGDDFFDYLFNVGTRKRFIYTDKIPEPRDTDAKHFTADGLVGLQRGQNIWVEKNFWDNAPMQERLDFVIHEFLVSEKLKRGPLSELDKEEILHVSTELSEQLNRALKGEQRITEYTLQSLLETNHFLPGLTKSEYAEIRVMAEKIMALTQKACHGKTINFKAAQKLITALDWIRYESSNELVSPAKRRFLKNLNEQEQTYLGGKRDIQSICRKVKESDQVEEFARSLAKPEASKTNKSDKVPAEEPGAPEGKSGNQSAD